MRLNVCPTCGARALKRVQRTVRRTHRGRAYVVPDLEFYECAKCRERVYDREALRRIEACSPAFRKKRTSNAA